MATVEVEVVVLLVVVVVVSDSTDDDGGCSGDMWLCSAR